MKALLPILCLVIGIPLGMWWKRPYPHDSSIASKTPNMATSVVEIMSPEETSPSMEPPPRNWKELLSGLPEDEWEALQPLALRVERFQSFDQLVAILDARSGDVPAATQELLYQYDEMAMSLLANRAAQLDPVASCQFEFEELHPFLLHGVAALLAMDSNALASTLEPVVPRLSEDTLHNLLPVIMKEDPRLGLAYILTEKQRSIAYDAWAQADPGSAAADALTLENGKRYTALNAVIYRWATSDPAAALSFAKALQDPAERRSMIRTAHWAAAYGKPEEALRLALREGGIDPIETSATWAARHDLDSAYATASAIADETTRQAAMFGIFKGASEHGDLETMLKAQQELPLGPKVAQSIHPAIVSVIRGDLPLAIEWLKQTDDRELFATSKRRVLESWIAHDIQAASAFAVEHPELLTDYTVVGDMARGLARVDASHAVQWASELASSRMQSHAMRHGMTSWIDSDFESATDFALGLEDAGQRNRYLSQAADYLMNEKQDVQAWLASLPEADRETQTVHVAKRRLDTNVMEAFELLAPKFETEQPSAEALRGMAGVMGRWARFQPAEAATWLQEQPHDALRQRAMEGLVKAWMRQSPSDAIAFVDQLGVGAERDQAIAGLSEHLCDYAPEEAFARAGQIQDPELRDRHLRKAIVSLAQIDLPAAETRLRGTSLSDKERQVAIDRIKIQTGVTLALPQ